MAAYKSQVTIVLLIAGLSACGGGGGGSGTSTLINSTDSPVYPALALTTSNAETTSGEVANSADIMVGAGSAGSTVVTGVAVQTDKRPSLAELMRWSLTTLDGLRGQIAPTLAGVVVSSSVNCTGGGSVAVSWDDADNDGNFTSGDSFTMTFTNCVELGVTISGAIALTGFSLTGDPQLVTSPPPLPWSLGATFTFTDLYFDDSVNSLRINGDLAYSANTTNGQDVATDISGTRLILRVNGITTTTVRDFAYSYTENLNTLAYALDYSGTADIGSVNGRVTFATTVSFTGSDILSNQPTAGSVLISGASGSTVTLVALGGDNIRLDVDANGDGGVDQSLYTTWTNATSL